MNFLLFVSFNTGLLHNASHTTLEAVRESIKQLKENECAGWENAKLPNLRKLKEHLNAHDDYTGRLSNGTWFHIQPKNVFETVK